MKVMWRDQHQVQVHKSHQAQLILRKHYDARIPVLDRREKKIDSYAASRSILVLRT